MHVKLGLIVHLSVNHLTFTISVLIAGLLCGCATVTSDNALHADRCDDDIVDVVQRFEQSPIDTMITVTLLGRFRDSTSRHRDLSTCSSVFTMLVEDSATTHAYLPSKALVCVSHLTWIDRIVLSPTPLPLPVDKGQ